MKKTFCDVCEKETMYPKTIIIEGAITKSNTEPFHFDFCEGCRLKLLQIIKNKEKFNEKT